VSALSSVKLDVQTNLFRRNPLPKARRKESGTFCARAWSCFKDS
jgi:hypothetical protein